MTLRTDHTLDAALAALVEEFEGVFSPVAVEQCLNESYDQLLPARVTGYLPLLAHRFARERLRAASRVGAQSGLGMDDPPLVLFVCGANSGRSQLAAALLAHLADDAIEVASAGTMPAGQVQTEVTQALAEVGIETDSLFPKPLTREVETAADVVVTMGCVEQVAVSGAPRRYLDWEVADPAGQDLDRVREIRDEIEERVRGLLSDLAVQPRA